jgi:hypothetical protein
MRTNKEGADQDRFSQAATPRKAWSPPRVIKSELSETEGAATPNIEGGFTTNVS